MLHNVLIVDDDPVSLKILETALDSSGIKSHSAEDGKSAFDLFQKGNYQVVLTDIIMPNMDGQELIQNIKQTDKDPIILVLTTVSDVSRVIEIMKEGVHDYILKPINKTEINNKIMAALELSQLRRIEKSLVKEREIRVNQQLANRQVIEKIMTRDYDKFDKELFTNLKTSFSQGSGFGGLVTLISLLSSQAKRKDDSYIISADLMDLVVHNAKMSQNALDFFGEIEAILTEKFTPVKINGIKLKSILKKIAADLKSVAEINKHSIIFSDQLKTLEKYDFEIYEDLFAKAVKELFMNTLKFSEPNSNILVFCTIQSTEGNLVISFLNKPSKNDITTIGVPDEYSKIVFEPFFRLVRTVREEYNTLDFGLGLTMVEKVIRKHSGRVEVRNIEDHLEIGKTGEMRVNMEIYLPIHKSK